MNYKSISIFMAFLLIFGFLSFSFASYGDQEIPTLPSPPGGHGGGGSPESEGGGQGGGGSPDDNGNSSGGGSQTTTTTIQTGTVYVNPNSQDMVVVKKNSKISTNTTTGNKSQSPNGTVILPKITPIPVPDPIVIIVDWVKPVVPGLRDPDWPYTQNSNETFIPEPRFVHLAGNATTSQVTPAGTVPHQVADSNDETYYAFCMEPGQKAQVGETLTSSDISPAVIYDLVEKSNPDNINNAYNTQIKIWAILTGGNIDPHSGEASLLKEKMGISDNQFNEDVNTATEELKKEYGVKDGQISLLLDYRAVNIFGYNMLENLFTGIKHLLGWYSPYKPLSQSLSSSQNDMTIEQQSTPADTTPPTNQTSNPTPMQPGPNQQVCTKCGGSGQISEQYSYAEWVACSSCGGSGQIYDQIEGVYVTCPTCHGSKGSLVQKTGTRSIICPVCGGKGVV
jgi:hypothetical protein